MKVISKEQEAYATYCPDLLGAEGYIIFRLEIGGKKASITTSKKLASGKIFEQEITAQNNIDKIIINHYVVGARVSCMEITHEHMIQVSPNTQVEINENGKMLIISIGDLHSIPTQE